MTISLQKTPSRAYSGFMNESITAIKQTTTTKQRINYQLLLGL